MKTLLVIGYVWPEPQTTAAGNRMVQLLQAFLLEGFSITFASASAPTLYTHDLKSMGVQTVEILLNDSSFDRFVEELSPEIVLFDRFMVEEQFGWRVAEAVPGALRILNTEDLHSLRKSREACLKNNQPFTVESWLGFSMTKREIASIYRCDWTLLVSTYEFELLQKTLGIPSNLLYHLPFLLEGIVPKTIGKWLGHDHRSDFVCFGNGKHAPNVDAINYLKKEIWPLIKKELKVAKLHIYGAYLSQGILELNNPKEGFLIHGWVEGLEEKLQNHKVNLAPLRFGAGIKGKLTQSMQNGLPSVTTSIGAEGMHSDLKWAGEVANDPKEFAQKAISLYSNKEKWLQAQQNGVAIINTQYNRKRLLPKFFKALNTLGSGLSVHRANNFLGAMLMHQTLSSTKYMGKWIEEKNKKTQY